jgi:GxxExxY protein
MGKLLHEELSYQIRGILFRVYNTLGPGFREETYKQAAKRDLLKTDLPIEVEKDIPIPYEDDPAIDVYRLDILVDKKILLELKALAEIHERFVAQTLSELLASKIELAMLVNFGSDPLEIRRLLNVHLNPAKKENRHKDTPRQPDLNDLAKQRIVHKDLCYALYGYFYKIYNILGPGYRETTYEKAFIKELSKGGFKSETDKEIPIVYDNTVIDTHKIKLIVDDKIIVYVKAYADLDPHWKARLKSELRASNLELGLIVNFGSHPLVIQRVLNSGKR